MDVPAFYPSSPRNYFFPSAHFFPYQFTPVNNNNSYVHWTETPESHIYSADIPGVKKEEIELELEDSRYLIIRTEHAGDSTRNFHQKFRLPQQVYVNAISAKYVDGVLKVTVPRRFGRRGFFIDPADRPERVGALARAA